MRLNTQLSGVAGFHPRYPPLHMNFLEAAFSNYKGDLQAVTCLVATGPNTDLQRSVHTNCAARI